MGWVFRATRRRSPEFSHTHIYSPLPISCQIKTFPLQSGEVPAASQVMVPSYHTALAGKSWSSTKCLDSPASPHNHTSSPTATERQTK